MKLLPGSAFALAVLLGFCPPASSAPVARTAATQNVLLVGDSLSAAHRIPAQAGWVHLLQQRVSESGASAPKIINASRGGKTLADALQELPALIAAHQPRLVILELGANDAILGARGIELKQNMTRLIAMAHASGAKVAILGYQIPPKLNRDDRANMLRRIYLRVARDEHVVLLPSLMAGISDKPALLLDDGVHPGVEAQKMMLDNAWPTLRPLLLN